MGESEILQELANLKAKQMKTYAAAIESRTDEPTESERMIASNLLEELEYLDDQIQGIKRRRGPSDPGFLTSRGYAAGKQGYYFRSFGEQLLAVHEAGQPGGKVDQRLYKVAEKRAATGMSEGIPSDGGSNKGPSWK